MAELEVEPGYQNFLDGALHFDQVFLLGLARKDGYRCAKNRRVGE